MPSGSLNGSAVEMSDKDYGINQVEQGKGVGRASGGGAGLREVRSTDIPNPGCATGLGKSPHLAEPQFPYL